MLPFIKHKIIDGLTTQSEERFYYLYRTTIIKNYKILEKVIF